MTTPTRIQLSRTKGWRMPANTVKVDRSTRWGNPYVIGEPVDLAIANRWGFKLKFTERRAESRAEAVQYFRLLFFPGDVHHEVIRAELRGKNLACWCPLDRLCHADVLLKIANA